MFSGFDLLIDQRKAFALELYVWSDVKRACGALFIVQVGRPSWHLGKKQDFQQNFGKGTPLQNDGKIFGHS